MKKDLNAQTVASAIAKANVMAGWPQDGCVDRVYGVEERAENLLRMGYVVDGDPSGWGDGKALVTIHCEGKGTPDDCELPMDYYNDTEDYLWMAEKHLPEDVIIEWINPGVACVFSG